jgi:hypothetical protein
MTTQYVIFEVNSMKTEEIEFSIRKIAQLELGVI